MPGLKIGWPAIQSDAPLRVVVGTNGENYTSWADVLYYYYRRNYKASSPPLKFLDLQNEPPHKKTTYGVLVRRAATAGDRKPGKGLTAYEDAYEFLCYARRKETGEFFPELENMINEIKRIFIEEYESHAIAGIRTIDHFKSGSVIPPESSGNPWPDMFVVIARIVIYYSIFTQLQAQAPNTIYQGHRYAAGTFTKLDY